MASLFQLAGSIFIDNDKANKSLADTTDKAEKTGTAFSEGIEKAGKFATGIATAATVAAGAITAIASSGAKSYAEYEQLEGGIETMFGDSAGVLLDYADDAYKTAGLSANDYLNTIMGFSASLVQSLGGDTATAAEAANQALIDMSDNANKMGTDMGSIQNAYSGFAKQNYTMLDNLKLGYGGTKTEMERLLADASELSGVEYNIDNLNDVYEAIHVIQTEMGITGTTALEASTTISGSTASIEAAFENVKTEIGEAVAPVFSAFLGSVMDALPMIQELIQKLTPVIKDVIKAFLPQLTKIINTLLPTLADLFIELLPSIGSLCETLLPAIVDVIGQLLPPIIKIIQKLLPVLVSLFNTLLPVFTSIVDAILPVIVSLIDKLLPPITDIIKKILPVMQKLFDKLMPVFKKLVDAILPVILSIIDKLMPVFTKIVEAILPVMEPLLDALLAILKPILDLLNPILEVLIALLEPFLEIIEKILPPITNLFSKFADMIKKTVGPAIADFTKNFVGKIKTAFGTVKSKLEELRDKFKSIFEAIKDFVKKPINAVIGFINGLCGGVVKGVNKIVSAMNNLSFDVPDWVPGLGGKKFGFSLKELSYTDIPLLANGAVLEPNNPMLAVVGDQKKGKNIEAPLDTIKQAVSEVLAEMTLNVNVSASPDTAKWFSAMQAEGRAYNRRTGQPSMA